MSSKAAACSSSARNARACSSPSWASGSRGTRPQRTAELAGAPETDTTVSRRTTSADGIWQGVELTTARAAGFVYPTRDTRKDGRVAATINDVRQGPGRGGLRAGRFDLFPLPPPLAQGLHRPARHRALPRAGGHGRRSSGPGRRPETDGRRPPRGPSAQHGRDAPPRPLRLHRLHPAARGHHADRQNGGQTGVRVLGPRRRPPRLVLVRRTSEGGRPEAPGPRRPSCIDVRAR